MKIINIETLTAVIMETISIISCKDQNTTRFPVHRTSNNVFQLFVKEYIVLEFALIIAGFDFEINLNVLTLTLLSI